MSRRRVMLMFVAVSASAATVAGFASAARGPELPRAAEEVVRQYVRAHLRTDARLACGLSSLHGSDPLQRCIEALEGEFAQPGVRAQRWKSARVRRVRVRPDGRLLRAQLTLQVTAASGTRFQTEDVWWLERRRGAARVLRDGSFGSEALGYGHDEAARDRPVTPEQVRQKPRLTPPIACEEALGRRRLKRSTVLRSLDFRPTRAPSLDLVRVEIARIATGAPCLRFFTAEPWRPATEVTVEVDQREGEQRSVLARARMRIGGAGQISVTTDDEMTASGPAGGSGSGLALVLPARFSFDKAFTVGVSAVSTQASEPLIRRPLLALEPLEEIRLTARR